MGYMRHHAIVITGPKKSYHPEFEDLADVHRRILTIAAQEGFAFLVSGIIEAATNGLGSILIAPDGSKESWQESDNGNRLRDRIIAFLETLRYEDNSTSFDYVEVQFGDDECETKICRDSDEIRRKA